MLNDTEEKSNIPTAIINDGDVPVGNDVSSVPDKYLSSPKKKAVVKKDGVSCHMQKDGFDSTENSMGQKDVEKVQRHEVSSANDSFRLEDKKEIKESLATATMLEKKDDAGNDKGVVDDGLEDGFTSVYNSSILTDETKNP